MLSIKMLFQIVVVSFLEKREKWFRSCDVVQVAQIAQVAQVVQVAVVCASCFWWPGLM